MTREEAINELQTAIDLIKQNGKDWLDERDIPILQMAITAIEFSDVIMEQLDSKMFHVDIENEKTQLSGEDATLDTISRQAAIDAIRNNVFAITPTQIDTKINCIECVEKVPSVQPVDKDIHVPCNDTISRQAAIDAIPHRIKGLGGESWMMTYRRSGHNDCVDACLDAIRHLPSVQPEIIYCKDCVCGHCEVWLCGDGSTDVYGYCGRTNFRILPYDYCSRSERRENG